MIVKSEEDIIIEKEIERKPVFSVKNIFFFVLQLCIFTVIVIVIKINNLISIVDLSEFSPISIASVQKSISLLSITIMQLILPDGKKRILGVTYQNILFKWKILKYLNALDCMIYMLLLMIINISLSIASIIVNDTINYICKIVFMFIMLESFVLAVYMVYLGLITKFKKSRIYYLLYKRMRKCNSQSDDVYNIIVRGIKKYPFNQNDDKNQYLKVEVAILEYMKNHINDFTIYNENKYNVLTIIESEIYERKKSLE